MPEGDTIHKIGAWLSPRLTEQRLDAVRLTDDVSARALSGGRVSAVRARGKHLFIDVEERLSLRSHLGMHGSWHFYAPDEKWKKPKWQASIVLRSGNVDYVCFNAKEVEVVRLKGVRRRIIENRLGPDLIQDDVDPRVLVRRARAILDGDALLVDVLLDQRVAAGIGNVYKSEVLFIERLHPRQTLGDTSDDELARCFKTGAALLRQNLGGGKRVTRFAGDGAGRLWVYGRSDQPCHECDSPIRTSRLGRQFRSTYWCRHCQTPPDD